MMGRGQERRSGASGQALVEFVIVFPLLLLLCLTLIQAALLYEAKHLVQYAAFAAARAAAVGGDPTETAALVCLPVTGLSGAGGRGTRTVGFSSASSLEAGGLSGRDRLRYAAGFEKTRARVSRRPHEVEVEVEHHLELIVPIAGRLMASLMDESRRLSAHYHAPHIALRAATRLTDATSS